VAEDLLHKKIDKNLRDGLTAARGKDPKARRKQAEEMVRKEADKPEMWHEGDPMPDWAKLPNSPEE
jgi:uncharacterized protein HemY